MLPTAKVAVTVVGLQLAQLLGGASRAHSEEEFAPAR
jgi:hypothetical protein